MTQPEQKPSPNHNLSPYQRLLEDLPSTLQSQLRPRRQPRKELLAQKPHRLSPETLEYQRLREQFPQSVQDFMDGQVAPEEEERQPLRPRWCVCESPEGEFLKIRIFTELTKLVAYLASLEGREVAVWNFYGVPVRMTLRNPTSKQRYLLLPGCDEAVLIARGPLVRVDASLILDDSLVEKFQLDGWMGHPALAEASSGEYLQGNRELRAKKQGKSDGGKKDKEEGGEEKGEPVE